MHRVGALIGHVPIVGAEPPGWFLAVLATRHLARDRPLQAVALLQMPLQVAWVLLSMTISERGELLDAQVYSHDRPGVLPHDMLLLDQHGDVPMLRLLGDGGRQDFGIGGGGDHPPRAHAPPAGRPDEPQEGDYLTRGPEITHPPVAFLFPGGGGPARPLPRAFVLGA